MPDPPQDFTLPPPWISSSSATSGEPGAAEAEGGASAGAAARLALLTRVTARLPAPPATVAVAGDPGGGTARALADSGWRALDCDEAAGVATPGGGAGEPCEAVLLLLPAAESLRPRLEERIVRARRRLADGGRLLVAGAFARTAGGRADAAPSADEVTAALAEAGFVVRRREDLTALVRPLAEEEATRAGRGGAAVGEEDRARSTAWLRLAAELAGGERGWELFTAVPDPFVIRSGRPEDEGAIGALFAECFHADRDLAHWRWEYRQGPYGPAPVSVGVAADGRLVSHYAGYPVRLVRDLGDEPRTMMAFQIGDTMTAPDVRKIGRGPTSLLARTVAHFYARNCAGRVAFNYGFNRGNIQRFSVLFVGAHVDEAVPFRVLALSDAPLPPSGLALSRLAGYRVERVTAFDRRWDEHFDRVRKAYRFLVERDSRYLQWRYADRPDVEYFIYAVSRWRRLLGWSVFRRQGERLVWGDGLFDPGRPEAVRLLLARVAADPVHGGTKTIEGWFPDRPVWWGELVAGLGFERRPEPEQLALIYVPWQVDPAADFAAHFYYTKGDSDLF